MAPSASKSLTVQVALPAQRLWGLLTQEKWNWRFGELPTVVQPTDGAMKNSEPPQRR